MCTQYLIHSPADVLFYITNVAIPPLIFGLGFAGNVLLLLVLNARSMRRDSASYVYFAAIASIDLLTLVYDVVPYVRDVELLPVPVAHSHLAATIVWVHHSVEPMLRHTVAWYVALAVVIRFASSIRTRADAAFDISGRLTVQRSRWTRISSARIVALVVAVGCGLMDFTRFFDLAVVQLVGHCFDPDWELWSINRTRFAATRPFYNEIQPAVSALAGGALPIATTVLFTVILLLSANRCCSRVRNRRGRGIDATGRSVFFGTPADHDESDYQLTATTIAVAIATIVLDGPRAALDVADAFNLRTPTTGSNVIATVGDKIQNPTALNAFNYELVVSGLSLSRCAVNFILIATLNYDFRKTLRRTFCCCCPIADDVYYEPTVCCGRQSSDTSVQVVTSKDIGSERSGNRKDWKNVSSSTSSSFSSSKQRINKSADNRMYSASSPWTGDDASPTGIRGSSDPHAASGGVTNGFYCDVNDDQALWV